MYDTLPQLFVACFLFAYAVLLAELIWSALIAGLRPALKKYSALWSVVIRHRFRSWTSHVRPKRVLALRSARHHSSPADRTQSGAVFLALIAARASGFLQASAPGTQPAQASIKGVVTVVAQRQPEAIPGVRITLVAEPKPAQTITGTTGVEGRYQLTGLASGAYTLEAILARFRTFTESLTVSGADAVQDDFRDLYKLPPAYALLSRIRLSSSTDVLASAERVIRHLLSTYSAPNPTAEEIQPGQAGGSVARVQQDLPR